MCTWTADFLCSLLVTNDRFCGLGIRTCYLCLSTFTDILNHLSGLKVTFTPSAVVTEGQRVTLSCSTSCPLTDNTNYIWNFNSRPLTLPEKQNKHLVLDPVSSQHAGRYSCAVKTGTKSISASEKTLTVQNIKGKQTAAAAAGVCVALLVIIPLTVFLWIRWETRCSVADQ